MKKNTHSYKKLGIFFGNVFFVALQLLFLSIIGLSISLVWYWGLKALGLI